MNKPLPRWVWPLGIFLLIAGGVNFLVTALRETKTHSWQEQALLIGGLVVGLSIVGIYWGRKWIDLRRAYVEGRSSRLRGIPRIFFWLILFPVVLLLVAGMRHLIGTAPERPLCQQFLMTNSAVASNFGKVESVKFTVIGSSIGAQNGIRGGIFRFQVTGSNYTGEARVHWHDQDGAFIPTQIDETESDGELTTIWKNNQ